MERKREMEKEMDGTIEWLMSGPDWVRYNCMRDLFNMGEDNADVRSARAGMLADSQVQSLIAEVSRWESVPLKRHNDAIHPLHKLAFLADIGINKHDDGIPEILAKIMNHRASESPYQVLSNYPIAFGGSGKDEWLWCLCDAPSILYAISKMGLKDDPQVCSAIDYLTAFGRANGWPCKADNQLPRFKGPGKAGDPCPYANLLMLKLLALRGEVKHWQYIQPALDSALNLWESSQERHPYLFKMGNDFRKLKVPYIWYDILHLAEVISFYPKYHQDKRFQEILGIIEGKKDNNGRFTSESIWSKWAGWEFCQKHEPSRWLTFCVLRILKRVGRWSLR